MTVAAGLVGLPGRAAGLPSTFPDWTSTGIQAGANFGQSVASAGDVNGDGYEDVIAGAPFFDQDKENEGQVSIFFGSSAGPSAAADWTARGHQARALFGLSVAGAGDVNGDGYDDIVVGAPQATALQGQALLFLGSAVGPGAAPDWAVASGRMQSFFGRSVASAGDVNGDGYDDVIVGAPLWGPHQEGAAFLFFGSPAGPSTSPDWVVEGHQAFDSFGQSVASAGDVNGDGYDDVIVGAPSTPGVHNAEGLVTAFLGSPAGPSQTPDWFVRGHQPFAFAGWSVASAGDVNGDGYDDVIVGSPSFDESQSSEGQALVFLGSASGPSAVPDWTARGHQEVALLGVSIGSAGDVNGDGYDDVIVGAPRYDQRSVDEGAAVVFLGKATGLAGAPDWTARGHQRGADLGASVGSAGDVNGDGFDDVIIGAPSWDRPAQNAGDAFAWFGPL